MFKNIQSAFNNAMKTVNNVVKSVTRAFSGGSQPAQQRAATPLTQYKVDQAYRSAGLQPVQNYRQTAQQTTPVTRAMTSLSEGRPSIITPSANRGIGVSAPKTSKDIAFYARQADMDRLSRQISNMLEPSRTILAYVDKMKTKQAQPLYGPSSFAYEPPFSASSFETPSGGMSPEETARRIAFELSNPKTPQQQQNYSAIINGMRALQRNAPTDQPSSPIGREPIAMAIENLATTQQSMPFEPAEVKQTSPVALPPESSPRAVSLESELPRTVARTKRPKLRGGSVA